MLVEGTSGLENQNIIPYGFGTCYYIIYSFNMYTPSVLRTYSNQNRKQSPDMEPTNV